MRRFATTFLVSFLLAITVTGAASAAVSPPAQAVAAGLGKLGFDEEFTGPLDIGYGTSGHKWNAGLWWEPVPSSSAFHIQNHVLTITASASQNVELCTQYHDASGGTYFQGGYFEASMRCTDWSAFWLYCTKRPQIYGNLISVSNPLSWTNEIDIVETDPGSFNAVWCTLHKNTSGDGGVPDGQNNPDQFNVPYPVLGVWHTYGVLWTRDQITWYVDNVKVASVAPYQSTWQPVQLILSAQPGGVNGSPSSVLPPTTEVQWVRVWQ